MSDYLPLGKDIALDASIVPLHPETSKRTLLYVNNTFDNLGIEFAGDPLDRGGPRDGSTDEFFDILFCPLDDGADGGGEPGRHCPPSLRYE